MTNNSPSQPQFPRLVESLCLPTALGEPIALDEDNLAAVPKTL
jgi:hypothetical protein